MPIITNDGYNDINLDQRRSSSIVPADTFFRQAPPDEAKYKHAMEFAAAAERLGSSIQSATAQIGNTIKANEAEKERKDALLVEDTYASVKADIAAGGPQAAQANPMLAELSPTAQMRVNQKLGADDASTKLLEIQNEYAEQGLWSKPEESAAFFAAKDKEAAALAASRPGWGGGYYTTLNKGIESLAHGASAARAGDMQKKQYEEFGQTTLGAVLNRIGPRPDEPQTQTDYGFNDGKAVTTQRASIPGAPSDTPTQPDPNFINKANAIGGVKIDDKYGGQCGKGVRGCTGALFDDPYFKKGIGSTGMGGTAASLSKGNDYLQKSGLYQPPQAAGDVNDQNYLNSLPIGTVISAAGGDGNGHVQVKIGQGQWASDALQGNKVLTSRAGGKQAYTDFVVHMPNEAGLAKVGGGAGFNATGYNPGSRVNTRGGDTGFSTGSKPVDTDAFIAHYEGFKSTPYWDVNHYRVGHGSDTITTADGQVIEVKQGMTVSKEDAARDLSRRRQEFQAGIVRDIGQDAWSKLTPGAQTALTSFAYNYGDGWANKAPQLAAAAKSGDVNAIAEAILARRNDNGGVNSRRRRDEAELAAGRADFSTLAARGDARGLDREFHFTATLDGRLRRDSMVKSFTDYAMKTGDTRVLDAIPPELITPGAAADIQQARKVAGDVDYTRRHRQLQMQHEEEQQTIRDMKSKIDEKIVNGHEIDMGVDTRDKTGKVIPEVFDYAKSHQLTESSIPVLKSDTNRANLEDRIEAAAAAGDLAVLHPSLKDKGPAQIRDWIDTQPDIRTTDKIALKKKLDKIMKAGAAADAPDSKAVYKGVDAYVKTFEALPIYTAINGASPDPLVLKDEAHDFYKSRVRMMFRQAMSENGGESPANTYDIYEKAAALTKAHVKELAENVMSGKAAGAEGGKPADAAKPAEQPKVEPNKIKMSDLPPNAHIQVMGGRRFVKFQTGDDKIEVKEVTD